MAKTGDQQIQNQVQNGTQAATTNSQQSQTEQATTTKNPWEQAQPLLASLINNYSAINPAVTGDQSSALTRLNTDVSGIPNFGATGTDAVNKFFNSSTTPQVGMLSDAFAGLNKNIGATASGAELDPYSTPGFSDAIATMTNDITNKVKGVYAGSGRDPSGAGTFAKSLGRGLTEGIAPTIANQFNTNNTNRINAANQLYGAGNTTAGNITTQEQIPLANSAQGFNLAGMLSSLFAAPGTAQLGAANAAQQQPQNNLAGLLTAALGLGGQGGTTTAGGTTTGSTAGTSAGTTSGTSNTTTSQPQSLLSNILGGLTGGVGLLSAMGGSGGGLAALAPLLALSDKRAKDEVEPIGKLNDGQDVVRFRYKGDPMMRIGLLAQDVAEYEPDAVHQLPIGLLAVDHRRATDRAAEMGRRAA